MTTALVLGVCLLTLIAFSLADPRPLRGRSLAWLRCLLPAWRFFEHVGQVPQLGYRSASAGAAFGAWQRLPGPPPRSAFAIVLNARGNLWLACRSLIEQLDNELDRLAPDHAADGLVSYRLTQGLVLAELRRSGTHTERYQFALFDDAQPEHALWLSQEHPAEAK